MQTPQLHGPNVRLDMLEPDSLPEILCLAVAEPELWTHIPYPMRDAADVTRAVELMLALRARGEALPFTTRLTHSNELVGGTSIWFIDPKLPVVEIGGTWLRTSYQGTYVNTEAKLLQLGFCFDTLACARVELKTDERNAQSRNALSAIGATFEGIRRQHMRRADGSLRDSAVFSVVQHEWPRIRAHLTARRDRLVSLSEQA
jgi:RimJ/RimL family protein N-acetyltransferase